MQNKTVKLFALGALAAATTFGANAENTYDYFVGFDAGTHVSGKVDSAYENSMLPEENYNGSSDTDASAILGISGGAIINDHHRVKFGIAYDALTLDVDSDDDTADRTDLTASYDYMLPIANKLNWTVGAHMGYEFFENDVDYMDGFTYGVQTGLDYRLTKNWSFGAEIAYTFHNEAEPVERSEYHHDGIVDVQSSSVQIEDDVTIMANVQYHF
ncbi:outer membrane beta-barrel protein [Vibrio pectenicida]|uniref:Transcriptional regulator n=1 Tax=Vibrio pectenicida TaxID=62763 RepID=A0A3R9FN36_9VIBR|nr:outer membrane beta-barrel protein [Vibrio pectenicida]RSD31894.1 transcriptional regulator [Vibrio pectenicida]